MNNNSTGLKLGGNIPLWKYFLYAMITCFSICGIILILSILGILNSNSATTNFILRLWGSSAVLGLFSLFTMNNLFRYEETDKKYVKGTSIAAIVMNIIWVLPWILVVWGLFDSASFVTVMNIVKIIANGIVLAIILTIFAEYLGYKDYTPAIRVMKYLSLGLTAFVGGYTLIQMNASTNIFGLGSGFYTMLAIMVVILIFCLIVTPILVRVQKRKNGEDKKVVVVNQLSAEDEAAMKDKIRSEMEAEMRAKIEQEVRAEMSAQNQAAAPAPAPEAPAPEAPATPAGDPNGDGYLAG